jgi:hypothetical protein
MKVWVLLVPILSSSAFAAEPDIFLMSHERVQILATQTNAQDVVIKNISDDCEIHVGSAGHAEARGITQVGDSDAPQAIQIVEARFGDCVVYFGRVKNVIPENDPSSMLLGNIVSDKDGVLSLEYVGKSREARIHQLTQSIIENERSLPADVPALSLVQPL